ncbi:phage tail length tape measure family protein [Falsiruegeria litorea]|uniref:phage tail length tape measure family protein n=1 Tax=Falsiruegeria litorea TaxID=1280831 RepID=UPI001BFE49F7|nr:phage tail length tape measure family protein [Falsiruegeria litorea]MBT8169873.1 phage tail length tape measure family protein [Falsiruegeria litorea]
MLGKVKDLFFNITAGDKSGPAFGSVNRRLRETDGLAASVNERMGWAGRSMQKYGAVGSVATLGVAAAFRDVIGLYDEQARAEAKVAQAVRQTGGAAGFTADQLFTQASALQEISRYGDEGILNSVTAQLLTFKEISGDVFTDAQRLALDLATTLDGDVQSAAIMMGKALNDPIAGISAMSRAGVTFSQSQKELIKDLVRSGDVMGAQRLILTEIESAYGGQAQAAREAGAGIVDAWQNTWGDVKEIVGGVLVDVLPPIIGLLEDVTGWFKSLTPEGQKTVVMLGALAVAIPPVTIGLGLMVSAAAALSGPVGLGIAAITGLTAAAAYFWPEVDNATKSTDLLTAAIGDEITQAQLLQGVIGSDTAMSVAAAKQKLAEAKARLANVQAIYEEKRALGLASEGRVGVGLMSMPDPVADRYDAEIRNGSHRTSDGRDIFDPRAQAEYEGRVDLSGNTGVQSPMFSDEQASEIDLITGNIEALESAIAIAENGVVTFGNGLIVPVKTAERLKDEIGGGGLTKAMKELTGATDDFGKSQAWGDIKQNMRDLVTGGQEWSDTWRNMFGSVLDRLFDVAFSPAWDQLFDNLEGVLAGGDGKSPGGSGGGGAVGNLLSGAVDWVGNILGLDTGGDVQVNGKAGVDRNLTVLRTSDQETVSVRRKGDSMGGGNVNVYIQTPNPAAFQSSKAQVGHQIGRAVAAGNRAS